MSTEPESDPSTMHLLVKMRPSRGLRAAESHGLLEPLYDEPSRNELGVAAASEWFLAALPGGDASPWDLAHARVADRLGVAASDIEFVEPDVLHSIYPDPRPRDEDGPFAIGGNCVAEPQSRKGGKAKGPAEFAWHLDKKYTQLEKARESVEFAAPKTRIAHLDTGYARRHVGAPKFVRHDLERSFVRGEEQSGRADDPNNWQLLLDNSGHGTGTLSILAGGAIPEPAGRILGGAPDAEIVPLRIADSVVLLRTSAFARALRYAVRNGCDVVSMSMGGLPSRTWREAVDDAYMKGVVMVCAAGNNYSGLPTRGLVYPARYGRVIAVCGAMANGKPYASLREMTMEGNYGPKKKMKSAMAAYTPNIPWARYGCDDTIDLDGAGTSSATPQVAAAAALWLEKYKGELPRDWRRVEAVRHALFRSAHRVHVKQLGNGILRAHGALGIRPMLGLPKTKSDSSSWAFLRVITGLGIDSSPPRELMFNLELAQRWLQNPELEALVPEPDEVTRLDDDVLKQVMQTVIEDEGASLALRRHVAERFPAAAGGSPARKKAAKAILAEESRPCESQPELKNPKSRRLRVYATDPSLSAKLATAGSNEVTMAIAWEPLRRGPVGDYLQIEDDKAAYGPYRAVDLDDPRLLAQDGWAPSEGNPQFHQQMVYAVAMRTIEHFERSLGRPVLWRHRANPDRPNDDSQFVRRLTVRPHALQQANAYYSPDKVALEFGYFDVEGGAGTGLVPGSRVYTCLSHDIVAHETTHAILDGMFQRFNEPSNPDVLAFHEGFADIIALLQHFTIPELLEREIRGTRGQLETESMLGSLAVQLGQAMGGRGALRDAIGRVVDGVWQRREPDPAELERRLTPHARGAILVAAIFDAFLAIYGKRTADLVRIYTGGSGVLPEGEIHPDLVHRLAAEASKSARHVLAMCIRALDYLPPVDVTFFEYLRALITADYDLVRDDRHNYRVAFVEAFRQRGIHPPAPKQGASDAKRTFSVETLRWEGLDISSLRGSSAKVLRAQYDAVVEDLKAYANACFYISDRETLFHETRNQRRSLHQRLRSAFKTEPHFARELGVNPEKPFEVHVLRRAMRPAPDGKIVPQVIVSLAQSARVDAPGGARGEGFVFRGGSTLVVDLSVPAVSYRIVKNIESRGRKRRAAAFVERSAADPLQAMLLRPCHGEPFAVLHSLAEDHG